MSSNSVLSFKTKLDKQWLNKRFNIVTFLRNTNVLEPKQLVKSIGGATSLKLLRRPGKGKGKGIKFYGHDVTPQNWGVKLAHNKFKQTKWRQNLQL